MRPFDWFLFSFVVAGYLLPSIVAFNRSADRASTIALLNVFLGFTLIGWLCCLYMALNDTVTIRHHGRHGYTSRGLSNPRFAQLPRGKARVEPRFD